MDSFFHEKLYGRQMTMATNTLCSEKQKFIRKITSKHSAFHTACGGMCKFILATVHNITIEFFIVNPQHILELCKQNLHNTWE